MACLRRIERIRRLRSDRWGSTAVEFALLAWPFVMLIMGGIQLAIYQYTQLTLSNALFDTASAPEAEVLSGDMAGYKTVVCAQIRIMPAATCKTKLLVELMPLDAVSTVEQVIGATFLAGASMNLMVLRAALPVTTVLPFLPTTRAKASVVFRRS